MLASTKPANAASSKGLRRMRWVAAVSGMAATSDPIAYRLTSWPAMACGTPSPALICGSNPAGKASVRIVTKPASASASSDANGRPPLWGVQLGPRCGGG
ncbi:hypothetical protein GCM10027276_00610 [Comamonas piscis]